MKFLKTATDNQITRATYICSSIHKKYELTVVKMVQILRHQDGSEEVERRVINTSHIFSAVIYIIYPCDVGQDTPSCRSPACGGQAINS